MTGSAASNMWGVSPSQGIAFTGQYKALQPYFCEHYTALMRLQRCRFSQRIRPVDKPRKQCCIMLRAPVRNTVQPFCSTPHFSFDTAFHLSNAGAATNSTAFKTNTVHHWTRQNVSILARAVHEDCLYLSGHGSYIHIEICWG